MSYDITLVKNGATVRLARGHAHAGGIRAIGGTDEAWLNVTYNYAHHFRRIMGPDGIRSIYGVTAGDSISLIRAAASQLGTDRNSDYWAPTEGNARAALESLIALAELAVEDGHGDAVWDGD